MKKHRILFVCLGNICRSPMAEFVMKDLAAKAGLSSRFEIASAATCTDEIGHPVYPPAREKLLEHGISCEGKTARQITREDYARYDLIIGMDDSNLRNIRLICGGDPEGKVHLMMEYAGSGASVADPWFTRDFEAAWVDILAGCTGLLRKFQEIEERENLK